MQQSPPIQGRKRNGDITGGGGSRSRSVVTSCRAVGSRLRLCRLVENWSFRTNSIDGHAS